MSKKVLKGSKLKNVILLSLLVFIQTNNLGVKGQAWDFTKLTDKVSKATKEINEKNSGKSKSKTKKIPRE